MPVDEKPPAMPGDIYYAQMFLYQKLILVMNMLKMIIEDNQ